MLVKLQHKGYCSGVSFNAGDTMDLPKELLETIGEDAYIPVVTKKEVKEPTDADQKKLKAEEEAKAKEAKELADAEAKKKEEAQAKADQEAEETAKLKAEEEAKALNHPNANKQVTQAQNK